MPTRDREVYVTKVDTELNALSTKLSILEAAERKAPKDADFDYDKRLSALREQRDSIRDKLSTLQDSGSSDWESTRTEMEAAMEKLEKGVNDAMEGAGLTTEAEKERQEAGSRSREEEEESKPSDVNRVPKVP